MKKSIIKIGACFAIFLSFMLSCETSEETYSEFTQDGETIYIGAPVNISSIPVGINQLRLLIGLNADPKISKGIVTDVSGSIVKEFDINLSSLTDNTVGVDVELNEGNHTLFVRLRDNSGNESITKEVQVRTYGESYRSGLISRLINSIIRLGPDTVIIDWADVLSGTTSSTLTYEDSNGAMQALDIANDVTETTITDFNLNGVLIVTSNYKPTVDSTFDIESQPTEYDYPEIFLVDKTGIAPLRLPLDASDGCWGNSYDQLFDGEINNGFISWHSCDNSPDTPNDEYPFVMSFDLGVEVALTSFRLNERGDCCGDRSPAAMQFWGTNSIPGEETVDIDSVTLTEWEADAITKGWVKIDEFDGNSNFTFTADIQESTEKYRYIRLVFISAINGGGTANFDEFTFWGK